MAISNPATVGSAAESSSTAPLIEVRGVRKIYQLGETEVHALRGVSVSIEAGDFVAIMGASGSGKSTFMNILGCLDKPTAGQYLLEGIDVSRLTKKELARIRNQKIGFVFQSFNLLGRTTALENTELRMLYSRESKKGRESRAREALALVGLADREDHFPSQLSGGQQLRLAVGATEEDVRKQFLIEAMFLGLIGGALGIAFGIASSLVVSRALEWPILIPTYVVVVSPLFAIAIGTIFGFYPARKASQLNPIEALRYE